MTFRLTAVSVDAVDVEVQPELVDGDVPAVRVELRQFEVDKSYVLLSPDEARALADVLRTMADEA